MREAGRRDMEREATASAPRGRAPVTLVTVAALFGRLVGLALALGIAVGLLLTAAAVALPAPAAERGRGHDGQWVVAPTLATEVSHRVAGVVARAAALRAVARSTDVGEAVESRRTVQIRTGGSGTD
jgi:hypothetical protein